MSALNQTSKTETARLDQIEASPVIGICYLDSEGRLVQYFDADPALKEAIVDYQQQRIQELIDWEEKAPKPQKSTLTRQKLKFD